MKASGRRTRVARAGLPQPTDASRQLQVARLRGRFQLWQLAAALDVHPRTIARWERGDCHPSKAQWSRVVGCLAQFVPAEAAELARIAGVASPLTEAPPVDTQAIEDALLRAADQLDVAPRRVRAAVREIVRATIDARGTLADLARLAEEKPLAPDETRGAPAMSPR